MDLATEEVVAVEALARLVAAGHDFTHAGLLGDVAPAGDVQAQRIDEHDPLRDETVIAVLTEDFATALCMRIAGNGEAIEFVHAQNRQVVPAVVRTMMRRFHTW